MTARLLLARVLLAGLAAIALLAGCSTDATAPPQSLAAQQETPNRTPIDGYRITLPSLGGVSSTLIPVGLNADRTLQVPPLATPMQAGLYTGGPTPGAQGPAVVVAHINANGNDGLFAHLDAIKPGDTVDVAVPGGKTEVFEVTRVITAPKSSFPTREVYSNTEEPELRLITCGGELDTTQHNYLSNTVAFARLTESRPTT